MIIFKGDFTKVVRIKKGDNVSTALVYFFCRCIDSLGLIRRWRIFRLTSAS